VLFWGILGVIILRAIMIFAGIALISKFSWILFVFAVILIYSGFKIFTINDEEDASVEDFWIYRILKKFLNIHPKIEGNQFFLNKGGKTYITPLFMALLTIEFMDVVFAIDSIPAILAITQNSFVIYSSNIFAILGLRALYFALENMSKKFKYIKYSLAIILILIGVKIFVAHFIDIPKIIPLLATILILFTGVIVSIMTKDKR
jgi:tellurite resistance protein TerC